MKRKSYRRRAARAFKQVRSGRGRGIAILALVAGGLYYLWKNVASAAGVPLTTVTPTATGLIGNPLAPTSPTTGIQIQNSGFVPMVPTPIPGSNAPTSAEVVNSGSFWSNLTPMPTGALGQAGGYINFPSGSQAAASLLPYAVDSAGNIYTQWAGTVYLVNTTPDANGNFTASSIG